MIGGQSHIAKDHRLKPGSNQIFQYLGPLPSMQYFRPHNQFNVGDTLPTMPLRLIADYFVPVELELTYTEACRRRRLIP